MDDDLKFPSGITVRQLKRDASKLSRSDGISHTEALDQLARRHANAPYDAALIAARRAAQSSEHAAPRVDIRWSMMIGDFDSACVCASEHLSSGKEVMVIDRPYEPNFLIKTIPDLQQFCTKWLADPGNFGEEQAYANLPLQPPSAIRSNQTELIEFVIGYVQFESGGLAGNKADLFAKYGPMLGLPIDPFLAELSDRPEASGHLNARWP